MSDYIKPLPENFDPNECYKSNNDEWDGVFEESKFSDQYQDKNVIPDLRKKHPR